MDVNVCIVEADAVSLMGEAFGFIIDTDMIIYDFLTIADKCFDVCNTYTSTFLIAFSVDNKVVGGCGLSITNGLHIDMLCVEPALQSQGIGTAILKKALEVGEVLDHKYPSWTDFVTPYGNGVFPKAEKRQITLEVTKSSRDYNKNISFYAKNGFQVVSLPGMSEAYCRKPLKSKRTINLPTLPLSR